MNINASIIDQQVSGIIQKQPQWLPQGSDVNKQKSAAFVLLCMATYLDLPQDEVREWITDGGNDAGVDGLYIGDVEEGEFLVYIFQGKYKVKDLSGRAHFPENGVEKAVNTLQVLFDPQRPVVLNAKIKHRIEEIRALIRDGYLPQVRMILCNNGAEWSAPANNWIDANKAVYRDQVEWIHFNHDSIVAMLQRSKPVDTTLTLSGKVIVEDMNYLRVLIGRVSVQAIQQLFAAHGDQLLERNIRRYLGLRANPVNDAIRATLLDAERSDQFYFYNNGITVVCDDFQHNALQEADHTVHLKNMQIINGGQTCKTIQATLEAANDPAQPAGQSAYVMLRVYKVGGNDTSFVEAITYATNSQNPVNLSDLRANDEIQKQLETSLASLGYTYKRKRQEGVGGSQVITSLTTAEAVLAIWREQPALAKFRRKQRFGKYYKKIFHDLNAAQALLAVLIFRFVENARKQPPSNRSADFIPYASHFIAMLIGRELLQDQGVTLEQVTHRNFAQMQQQFANQQTAYYTKAVESVQQALESLYGKSPLSLQQLSATFRRGDLLAQLHG